MDEKTLHALEGSIAKWRAIVDGAGEDRGVCDRPLCVLFHDYECDGCPGAAGAYPRANRSRPRDAGIFTGAKTMQLKSAVQSAYYYLVTSGEMDEATFIAKLNRATESDYEGWRYKQWMKGKRATPRPVSEWARRMALEYILREFGVVEPVTRGQVKRIEEALR